jgi:pyruvate dehydrogenase E1 component beta subunit
LETEGISAEVIDLRTIRPLDVRTIIESVKKTNRLVVIDESWPFAGVSSEVAYVVQKHAFDYLDAPVTRINAADTSLGICAYSGGGIHAQRCKNCESSERSDVRGQVE